jgi:hypothetical protein
MATQTTTVTGQQSIPTELMPYFVGAGKKGEEGYVPGILPKAQEIYSRDYATAVGDKLGASGLGGAGRVAGLSELEQRVGAQLGQMQTPSQFGTGTGLSTQAGLGQLGTVGQAGGYGLMGAGYGAAGQNLGFQGGQRFGEMGAAIGNVGQNLGVQGGQQYGQMGAGFGQQAADIGQMGLRAEQIGSGITQQSQDLARQQALTGQRFEGQATDPNAIQRYMNPYTQNVTDVQTAAAQRAFDVAQTQRQANAARAGAFGGSRQAIENAEAQRALQTQLGAIQATGQQAAYDKALQNMQFGTSAGLQGLSGAQSGLGTALQGGQLGLSGIGTALQGLQGGMQGADIGLRGIDRQLAGTAQGMQGAQIGLQGVDRQLAGTAQGMQGAQIGLQGVAGQQAGYTGANQAAATLGQLGTMQQAADLDRLKAMSAQGGTERGIYQQGLDASYSDFLNEINFEKEQLGGMANIARGVPTTQGSSTSTVTTPAPSFGSQLAGYGLTGLSLMNMFK